MLGKADSKPAPISAPSVAPTNSSGAKAPPEAPEPIVSEAAISFSTIRIARVETAVSPSAKTRIWSSPEPRMLVSISASTPTPSSPRIGLTPSEIPRNSKTSSVKKRVLTKRMPAIAAEIPTIAWRNSSQLLLMSRSGRSRPAESP